VPAGTRGRGFLHRSVFDRAARARDEQHETPRVHHAARRRGCVAARGARAAAAADAADRCADGLAGERFSSIGPSRLRLGCELATRANTPCLSGAGSQNQFEANPGRCRSRGRCPRTPAACGAAGAAPLSARASPPTAAAFGSKGATCAMSKRCGPWANVGDRSHLNSSLER